MRIKAIFLKTGIFLAVFLFLFQQANAQYEIVYDMQKDTAFFYKSNSNKNNQSKTKVRISKINTRKPSDIRLSVENINPFTWKAKITPVKKAVAEKSENPGSFFTNIIAGLGGDQLKILTATRSADNAEIKAQKIILQNKYMNLQQYKFELEELKFEKLKTEAEIKSKAEEIRNSVVKITGITGGKDDIDFNSAMRISGIKLDQEAESLEINMEEKNKFSDFYSEISKTYNEIVSAKFTIEGKYNRSQIDSIEGFTLEISHVDSAESAQNKPITRYYPLRSRAHLKISNSTGITFTYFQDNNLSYYVNRDTTIGSGNKDLFVPVLSAFVNFYSNRIYGFKWGGCFGVGMPIFQEANGKNYLNFMLGLCTVLGRNDPIVISVGFAGTKVNRLTNGWKIGDRVPNPDFEFPIQSQFRVGGFISLGFNITNLTKKNPGN
jgi:hypothetical protein